MGGTARNCTGAGGALAAAGRVPAKEKSCCTVGPTYDAGPQVRLRVRAGIVFAGQDALYWPSRDVVRKIEADAAFQRRQSLLAPRKAVMRAKCRLCCVTSDLWKMLCVQSCAFSEL